ncbi:hypothetical protein DNTS_018419 [Danionella cerebrum]|uniref:Uncharacterized protein n=1 Tax=Danionella cerebrum TaxID=2873325 RepID=A0A553RGR6_9TELE|nr:hypothetical protein DNTS_018419 [Danionella translucida]
MKGEQSRAGERYLSDLRCSGMSSSSASSIKSTLFPLLEIYFFYAVPGTAGSPPAHLSKVPPVACESETRSAKVQERAQKCHPKRRNTSVSPQGLHRLSKQLCGGFLPSFRLFGEFSCGFGSWMKERSPCGLLPSDPLLSMKQEIMAEGPRCKRRKQANPRRKNGHSLAFSIPKPEMKRAVGRKERSESEEKKGGNDDLELGQAVQDLGRFTSANTYGHWGGDGPCLERGGPLFAGVQKA